MSVNSVVDEFFKADKERYGHLSRELLSAIKSLEPLIEAINKAMKESVREKVSGLRESSEKYEFCCVTTLVAMSLSFLRNTGEGKGLRPSHIITYIPKDGSKEAETKGEYSLCFIDKDDLEKINSGKIKKIAIANILAAKMCEVAKEHINPSQMHHLEKFFTKPRAIKKNAPKKPTGAS